MRQDYHEQVARLRCQLFVWNLDGVRRATGRPGSFGLCLDRLRRRGSGARSSRGWVRFVLCRRRRGSRVRQSGRGSGSWFVWRSLMLWVWFVRQSRLLCSLGIRYLFFNLGFFSLYFVSVYIYIFSSSSSIRSDYSDLPKSHLRNIDLPSRNFRRIGFKESKQILFG